MQKRSRNPQLKHRHHEVYVEATNTVPHKYVMRCSTCKGSFVKWATKKEFDAHIELEAVRKNPSHNATT